MRFAIAGLLMLLCLCAYGQLRSEALEWEHEYTVDVLPTEAGWGGSEGENTRAELTDEGLRIVDEGTEHTQLRCYGRSWGARPERGGIVEATVRAVSCSGRSASSILVADGVHEDCLTFYPDRVELNNSGLSYEMDTTDGFHTYQIRIAGINIEVWVDGELAIDGWGEFLHEAHQGRRTVTFGSITSPDTGEAYWKGVRYMSWIIPVEPYEDAEHVVIYREAGVYACFPSLYRLEDGRLWTRFGTRVWRSHIDNTGGSSGAISSDGGYTWELTDEMFTDPRRVREDGTVITPHARGWIYVPEEQLPEIKERGRKWMHAREGTIAYLGDPRVRIEPPDGEAKLIELDSPLPGGSMGYHLSSAFLHEGDLWMTAIYCFEADGRMGVWAIRSEDNGETWEVVEVAPPMGEIEFGEAAICANGRGEIACMMRSGHGGKYNSYQCFSSDGGRTWSPPMDSGIWGYPSNLLLLEDGRMLCTYGYRRDAMGVRAVLSEDGGHTWDHENEIVLRADGQGNGGDNGYPISMQLQDGHVFTIYYINDEENVTHIAGTNWMPPPASEAADDEGAGE